MCGWRWPGVTKETVSGRVKDDSVLFAGEAGMDSNQVEIGRTYDGSFGPFDMTYEQAWRYQG